MNLNQYVANIRKRIFEDLLAGRPPSEGDFSEQVLKQARTKGTPQLGSTRFEPYAVVCEYIYPETAEAATVLTVRLTPPERIVFLPVPDWVVESIWQGEVSGSCQFESDAERLVAEFRAQLAEGANERWFGPQPAKRRE